MKWPLQIVAWLEQRVSSKLFIVDKHIQSGPEYPGETSPKRAFFDSPPLA